MNDFLKKFSKREQLNLLGAVLIIILVLLSPKLSSETTDSFDDLSTDVLGTDESVYDVTDVVDGDTIELSQGAESFKVRLIGVDTPETVHPSKQVECFGKEASAETEKLVLGEKVYIDSDPTQDDIDRYGRKLRYVWRQRDNLFLNRYLIEKGFAYEYTYKTAYKYQAEFKELQSSAETDGVGLWGDICD